MSDLRKEFEAWAVSERHYCFSDLEDKCSEGCPRGGEYRHQGLQDDWEVYQAAALKRDAEIARLKLDNGILQMTDKSLSDRNAEIAALKAAFSPRRWTKEQNQAWHENIPNLQSAFEALLAATYSQEGKAT